MPTPGGEGGIRSPDSENFLFLLAKPLTVMASVVNFVKPLVPVLPVS